MLVVLRKRYCDEHRAGQGVAPQDHTREGQMLLVPQEKLDDVRRIHFKPDPERCPCGGRLAHALEYRESIMPMLSPTGTGPA